MPEHTPRQILKSIESLAIFGKDTAPLDRTLELTSEAVQGVSLHTAIAVYQDARTSRQKLYALLEATTPLYRMLRHCKTIEQTSLELLANAARNELTWIEEEEQGQGDRFDARP